MHDYEYGFGHVDLPWTNKEHRDLPYENQPFNNPDDIARWKTLGYTQEHYTGEMYDMRNPWPVWFNMDVFEKEFGWHQLSWCFYKMTTGVILPDHIDQFVRFKKLYCDEYDVKDICRAVFVLEDWEVGHILSVADEPVPKWKAGDYGWFNGNVPHLAANIGLKDRYTLQLTGFNISE